MAERAQAEVERLGRELQALRAQEARLGRARRPDARALRRVRERLAAVREELAHWRRELRAPGG
jgi:hypothetical protein